MVCFAGCLVLGLAGVAFVGRFAGPRNPTGGSAVAGSIAATPFTSPQGKKGWSVQMPGKGQLATPAIDDGKVFVGGGFASYEFYAFNAASGKNLWTYRTGDDGPTAAVVDDGCVVFNTESCELEVLTTAGKSLWKKWLGDPLMSMPALHKGTIYMAFPDSKRDNQHYLAAFNVKTGKERWRQKIAGEVITAPVVDNDRVYLTTLEGTLYCVQCRDGQILWSERKNATSSPAVCNGKVFFSQRDTVADAGVRHGVQQREVIAYRSLDSGGYQALAFTARHADYLDAVKRKAFSAAEQANVQADQSVSFSSPPTAAKMEQAIGNVGQSTVAGVWSYQGSRPFAYRGKLYSSMGDTVHCADPASDAQLWARSFPQPGADALVDAALTPPVLANGKVFVGTREGALVCLSAETGDELWRATLGEAIVFQPAVAQGRVYVSTNAGTLFCIETGDAADHGWPMWGGGPAHNGPVE